MSFTSPFPMLELKATNTGTREGLGACTECCEVNNWLLLGRTMITSQSTWMKQTPILRWLQNRPRLIIDATLHVIHITPHARSDSTSWNSLSKHPDESWGCVHPHTGCNLLSICLAMVINICLHLRAHIGVCNVYIHVGIAIVHSCVCKHTVRLCSSMYRNQTVHRYHASWQKSNSSQVSRIVTLYAHVSAEVPVPLTSGHFCAQISGTIKPLTVLKYLR